MNGTATTLTDTQRALAAEHLSKADKTFVVAALVNRYPDMFDAILADLKGRPAKLEESSR